MMLIPWDAAAAIHWPGDRSIALGTLESCCKQFCDATPIQRTGAYILCRARIECGGMEMPGRLERGNLYLLAGEYLSLRGRGCING